MPKDGRVTRGLRGWGGVMTNLCLIGEKEAKHKKGRRENDKKKKKRKIKERRRRLTVVQLHGCEKTGSGRATHFASRTTRCPDRVVETLEKQNKKLKISCRGKEWLPVWALGCGLKSTLPACCFVFPAYLVSERSCLVCGVSAEAEVWDPRSVVVSFKSSQHLERADCISPLGVL